MAVTKLRIVYFFDALYDMLVTTNRSCAKVFKGTACTLYGYDHDGDPYISKKVWDPAATDSDMEEIYNRIVEAAKDIPSFKLCRLTKKANGYRFRFDPNLAVTATKRNVLNKIKERVLNPKPDLTPCPAKMPATDLTPVSEASVKRVVEKTNKEKKMNDFSLTNLKNAIINKVSTLDKKTITIIGIIILLLLIATRYQDIKDILIGIKDKVKRSKNFKAMMADGEKAVESLKKIVGVKSTGDKADE